MFGDSVAIGRLQYHNAPPRLSSPSIDRLLLTSDLGYAVRNQTDPANTQWRGTTHARRSVAAAHFGETRFVTVSKNSRKVKLLWLGKRTYLDVFIVTQFTACAVRDKGTWTVFDDFMDGRRRMTLFRGVHDGRLSRAAGKDSEIGVFQGDYASVKRCQKRTSGHYVLDTFQRRVTFFIFKKKKWIWFIVSCALKSSNYRFTNKYQLLLKRPHLN